jgi:hypothetical protein
MSKSTRTRRPLIEAIEPRLLFSATADIAVFDDGSHYVDALTHAANNLDLTQVYPDLMVQPPLAETAVNETKIADTPIALPTDTPPETSTHSLVFVDTSVKNYQTLVQDILNNPDNKNIELIYLHSDQDAIQQITDVLHAYTNVSAIHLISHGDDGIIEVGQQVITENTINDYAAQLQSWKSALTDNADILLYGCNISANAAGLHLLNEIHQLTGADVAASKDITGNKNAGGNWVLESQVGAIEHASLMQSPQDNGWQETLATTVYETSGSTSSTVILSPGQTLHQSFTHTSGSGTYSVNTINMYLDKDAFAQAQNITVTLSSGLGTGVLATASISSAALSTSLNWESFHFSNQTLNDGQTYYINISTSGSDGLIKMGVHGSNMYAGGTFYYDSLTPDANRDFAFEVTSVSGNNAPTVNNPLVSQTATKGSAFSYTFAANSFSDADGNALTYSATQQHGQALPSWLSFDANTRTFSGTPTAIADVQPLTIRVVANDGNGGTTYDEFVLSVSNRIQAENYNQTSGTSVEATSDTGGGSDVTSIDPADWAAYFGNVVGHTGTYNIDWRVASTTGGSIKLEPYGGGLTYDTIVVPNTGGAQNWVTVSRTVTFSDLITTNFGFAGVTGSNSINWFELTPLDVPTVSRGLADQLVTLNVPFSYQFSNTAGSNIFESNDALTFTATLADGSALPSWLSFNAATRTFSGTQTNSDLGDLNVRVTATNSRGASVYDDFAVMDAVNNAPVNTIPGSQTTNEDGSITFNQGAGITGTYYNNKTLTGPAAGTRTDPDINFVWPNNPGIGGIGNDAFSARWDGELHITETGNFQFKTQSDDGVRVYIDGQLVIDNWTNHGVETNTTGNIAFTAGKTYSVVVEYYESTGNAQIGLSWITPSSGVFTTVPSGDVSNMQQGLYIGNSISISDIDSGSGSLQVSLSVAHGTLTLPHTAGLTFSMGDGTADAAMVFYGTKDNINSALAFLKYTPTANFNGTDNLSITTSDLGNSGTGGAQTDTDIIGITVNSVNDNPTGTDKTITINEDAPYTFTSGDFGFNDGDVGDTISAVRIDSLPVAGTLKLSGVNVLAGDIITTANIGNLVFTPATDANGTSYASFTFSVRDQTNLFDTVPKTITLDVTAVNDNPTVTITPTTYAADEQVSMDLHGTGISVGDIDGDNLSVTVAAAINNSQLTASAGTTGIAIVSGNGTKTLVLSGTAAQLNDFFAGNNGGTLTYRIAANTPLPSTALTITASDGTLTGSDSATINITAINDGPTNTKPATQNTTEDAPVVFSAGNGNQISIADLDAGASSVQTTISVTNGVLTLAGTTGLSFITGDGTSDSSMTFSGTVADINAALATLTYTPTSNFNGASTLTIITDDLGNTGSGGALSDTDTVTINIAAANDAPTVANAIPDKNITVGTGLNFQVSNTAFNDADADTLTYTAQLAGGGALPSWLSFNAATRTFSGIPHNSDAGTINVDVTANDGNGGTVTDTFAITTSSTADITYINTNANGFELEPTNATNFSVGQTFTFNSGNGSYVVNELNLFIIAYGGAAQTVTVKVMDAPGGNILGTSSVASTSLNPSTKEWRSFSFSDLVLSDNTTYYFEVSSNNNDGAIKIGHWGNVYAGGTAFVNGAPDASKDLSFKINYENGSNTAPTLDNAISDKAINSEASFNYTIPANTFSDVDAQDVITYRAHLVGQATNLDWITFDTATRTFGGTPHFNQIGTWQVQVDASDNHGATVSEVFDVVVSNANTVPTPIPDQVVSEGSAYSFQFTAFNNANGHALTYTATQSDGSPLPAWFNFNAATRTFSGMADDGDVSVKSIKVTANDGFGGSVSDIFTLTVNNVQEAPTILHPIVDQNATGYVPFSFSFNADVASDPDIGDTLTYSAQLSGGGALPSWLSYNATTRTFSGTPTNADVGTLTINVIATDSGNNTATDTFNLVIATGNAPPVNTVPGAQNINEDTPLIFSAGNSNQIQITDADAGSNSVQVNLNVLHGGLSLASLTGLSFITGDGTSDANMSFTGSLININAALATLTYTSTANYYGSDTLSITTNDLGNTGVGGAHSDSDNVAITIASANDAPTVANVIPDQNATEDSAFNFQFASNTFNDIDVGDTLTYSTQLNGGGALPSWLSFNAVTRTFSGTPTNADVGTLTIDVTANDGNGGTVTDTFALVIANTNDTPILANAIPDQNATEDSAFNFQFASNTFNDIDVGDTLTYTTQLNGGGALPSWLSFNAATRTFSGTPTNADLGTLAIDVTASDGNGGAVTDTFALVIANTNDAPTIANAIPDQNATEDSAFNFQFASNTFNDADVGDTLTYTTQLNGGGTLPSWLSFNAATRTFSGTPTNADVGTLTIDVTASDGNGGTVNDTFALVIANTNDAPTLANAIPDQNATEDSAFNFQFASNTFNDADVSDTLTYTSQLNGGGALPSWLSFNAATRTFSGTPTNADVGTLTIDVTANDGNGGTVTDTFALVIANTNDAPTVANAIPDQNATEDSAFNFQFASNTFTDVDAGDTLTYSSTLNSGGALPSWLTFNAATRTFSGTPTDADVGTLTIDVTASDGNGGTVTDTFALVITNTNDAPTVVNAIPDQNATEDSAFNFQFASNTFTDVDVGNTLTYTTQLNGGGALPTWLTFNAATRTFSGTPTDADVGTLTIDVTASDGNGGTVTDTFALVITNTNDAPIVANAIPDQNATEDASFNFQFASNTFNDADVSDTLTYTSQLNGGGALPSWLSFNAATRTFSGTPTNADVGTLTINVIANDGHGGVVTDSFDLLITNTNDAPVITNPISNQQATENSAFTFQLAANTFNDPDIGDSLTYNAQLAGGGPLPAWLSFDSATRTFSGTPATADVSTLTIDVIATDNYGQSITANFVLNVINMNQAPTTVGIATINTLENSPGDVVDLFAAFADREDQDAQLTYSIVSNTNNTLVTQTNIDVQTGKLQLHYGQNQFGTSQITVRATDSSGASVDTSFDVNVAFVNQLPTSNGIKNIAVIQGSAPSTIDLSTVFNDIEDGRNLQYSIVSNSNPTLLNDVQINQQNQTSKIIYNFNATGETTITLRATDANGGFVDSTFKITVIAQKPTIPIDNNTPTTPVQDPTNNNGNGPSTGPVTSVPDPTTEITPPITGGGTNPAATVPTDNTLANNLIGNVGDGEPTLVAPTPHVGDVDESFDHNRYDRIVQQELISKKINDPLSTRTLISSLILPGEGFSNTDAAEFNAKLRKVHQEMEIAIAEEQQQKALLTGLTLSVTTGILIWSLRASSLLLALMSMLPLWRGIDPLPILEEVEKRKKDIEKQRDDKKAEDKNAKEVGYLFDNSKNPKDNG